MYYMIISFKIIICKSRNIYETFKTFKQLMKSSKNDCNCENCQCHDDSLKGRSAALTSKPGNADWIKRAPARGMMRAVGFTTEDFNKPLITVACPYTNITPCNAHIQQLGNILMQEIEDRGGKPIIFGTPV